MRKFTIDNETREFNFDQVDAMLWVVNGLAKAAIRCRDDSLEDARNPSLTWRDVSRKLGVADGWQEAAEYLEGAAKIIETDSSPF